MLQVLTAFHSEMDLAVQDGREVGWTSQGLDASSRSKIPQL